VSGVGPVAVAALLQDRRLAFLELEVAAGASGMPTRAIVNPRIQKPGLALAGYLPAVKPGRLQVLGESEYSFLATMPESEADARLERLVELEVPAVLSAKGLRPRDRVLACCDRHEVPFLVTEASPADAIGAGAGVLEEELAPRVQRHGVLVEVFSLGTLIVGDPGVGKSECALELIYRGHRLVADDIVVIRRTHDRGLRGSPHELLHNYLELRGVGIIDIRKHFGMTATSPSVTVSLVIQLVSLTRETMRREQEWREKLMERPHAWTSTEAILGIEVPKYTMAVAPGRAVAIMVETAVRRCLLAERGIHDERDFLDAINEIARGERSRGRGGKGP